MSIRSYKAIYEVFARLFPELNKSVNTWKGVRFAERHIAITMNSGAVIHFQYFDENDWDLTCVPDATYLVEDA